MKNNKNFYDQFDLEFIKTLIEQGSSLQDIANYYDVCKGSIYKFFKIKNFNMKEYFTNKLPHLEIIKDYKNNLEIIKIAKKFKVNHKTIQKILKKYTTYQPKTINKHGLSNHKLKAIYYNILDRCYNCNNAKYKNYGKRGIQVCNKWKENFIEFYNWSINNGWKEGLEIDRIDNDKDYCPKNCRFITRANNTQNRGSNLECTSRYKGVSRHRNKWVACIHKNNKKYHLGCFNSEEEAAKAYNEKAKEFWGEFAYQNKVENETIIM